MSQEVAEAVAEADVEAEDSADEPVMETEAVVEEEAADDVPDEVAESAVEADVEAEDPADEPVVETEAVVEEEPADDVSDEAAEPAAEAVAEADVEAEDSADEPVMETEAVVEEEPADDVPDEAAEPAAEAVAEAEIEAEDPADEPTLETEAVEEEAETADDEGEEPEGEPDDGRHWYVVHCYSGYENKVRHNLEQRIETMGMKSKIFDVVVPTEEEIEVKDGKRRTVERRVFPGYILVQMILTEESWYVVRNTPGVTGFVGMGNEPTPLRAEEVASIVKRMEAEAPRIKVTYSLGQKVRIIDGPFNDFIGTVDDIDMERAKVRVMVSFFGRETPVELDFLQVEKA
jgi:transcriptional antiterminator NusG